MPSQRQQDYMMFCKEPKTILDFANHFQVSHMTVRRELDILKALQLVKETGHKKGKQKLYRAVFITEGEGFGAYNITMKDALGRTITRPPVGWMEQFALEGSVLKVLNVGRFVIARLLAEKSTPAELDRPGGFGVSVEGSRAILEKAIEIFQEQLNYLEQLKNMPAWEGKGYLFTLNGQEEVDWKLVDELLREFEQVVNGSPILQKLDLEAQGIHLD